MQIISGTARQRLTAALCGGALLLSVLLLPSCGAQSAAADPTQEFQAQLTQRAAPCVGADKADPQDFVLDSVQYGHFSSPATEELCALFKYTSLVHPEGLDRTLAVVYDTEDLSVVASHEFVADQVQLQFLPAKDGRDYVLYLGTVTYQNISAYYLQLFQIGNSAWEPVSADLPQPDDARPGDCAYSLGDRAILRLNGDHTYTSYVWDREAERFIYVWDREAEYFIKNG